MTEGHYPQCLFSFSKIAVASFERNGEPLATRLRHQYLEKIGTKCFDPLNALFIPEQSRLHAMMIWRDDTMSELLETLERLDFAVSNEIMTCKHPCRRHLRVVENKFVPTHLICPDLNIPVCSRFIPFNGELIRRQSSTPDPRWRGWPWGLIECCW